MAVMVTLLLARHRSLCPADQSCSGQCNTQNGPHCHSLTMWYFYSASSVDSEAIDDADSSQVDLAGAKIKPVPRKRKTTSKNNSTKSGAKGKGKADVPISRNFVSTVEWPEHFLKLQKTFQAINTIYTFLSARKHMASTFDNLKSSVQAILKR